MTTQNPVLTTMDPFLAMNQEIFSEYSRVYQLLAQTSKAARTRLSAVLKRLRDEEGVKAFRPSWNFEAIQTQADAEKAITHLADVLEKDLAGTLETWHIKTHSIVINGKRISRGFYYHKNGLPVFDEHGIHRQHNIDSPSLPEDLSTRLQQAGSATPQPIGTQAHTV